MAHGARRTAHGAAWSAERSGAARHGSAHTHALMHARVTDSKVSEGVFDITYCALSAGTFRLAVLVLGKPIKGSPFSVDVEPAEVRGTHVRFHECTSTVDCSLTVATNTVLAVALTAAPTAALAVALAC